MVCQATGKQAFSRKFSVRVLRRHRADRCVKCLSGEYQWERYICQFCKWRHCGHWWLGGQG